MGKTLYLECYSGISGDMTVAALLDLGAREEALREALDALPVKGYEIKIGRAQKCGIDACDFEVVLEEDDDGHCHSAEHGHGEHEHCHSAEQGHGEHGHCHSAEHGHGEHEHCHSAEQGHGEHGHCHSEEQGHGEHGHCRSEEQGHGEHEHCHSAEDGHGEHCHSAEHGHTHSAESVSGDREHSHAHSAGHGDHAHSHTHIHRSYRDIKEMLDESPLKPDVRALAQKIFRIVGEAEANVHGRPLDEVHFHETGAVDSIVDIVGAAACAVDLGITDAYVSAPHEGQGHVWCQHGRIPVPAPAVAGIAAAEKLELRIMNVQGEMVTPTGAAIAAALRTKKGTPSSFCIRKIGMGAGKKDFPHANILRAMLIEEAPVGNHGTVQHHTALDVSEDEIWILETNLDDTTGEALGFAMEELLKAGARDVSYTPIYMKKNRPAWRLEVLCKEEDVPLMETLIFRHTTGIGLRKRRETRRILPRKTASVSTPFGEAAVKLCIREDGPVIYPEYESVRAIAQAKGKSYQEIYQRVVEEAWKKKDEF